jgi:hypothetical protein
LSQAANINYNMAKIHLESIERCYFKLKWPRKVHESSSAKDTKTTNRKNHKIEMKGMPFPIKKTGELERILNKKK